MRKVSDFRLYVMLIAFLFAFFTLFLAVSIKNAEAAGANDPVPDITLVKLKNDRVLFDVNKEGDANNDVRLYVNGNQKPLSSCGNAEYCFEAASPGIRSVTIEAYNRLNNGSSSNAAKSWVDNAPFTGSVPDAARIDIARGAGETFQKFKIDTPIIGWNVRLFYNNEYKQLDGCGSNYFCYQGEFPPKLVSWEANNNVSGVQISSGKTLRTPNTGGGSGRN